MQEELPIAGSESTFRNAPFVRIEVLTLIAVVGVGKVKGTPDPTLRRGKGNSVVIEQCHRPCIVLHGRRGERRFADLPAFRLAFDTASDGLCGLVGGENCVLTAEVGIFAYRLVCEGLHVALGVTLPPREVCGDLATLLPLGDDFFEQVALFAINREAGDCRPTHVVVCHVFNVALWLFTDGGDTQLYERAPPLPTRSFAPLSRSLRKGTPRYQLVEHIIVGIITLVEILDIELLLRWPLGVRPRKEGSG